MRILAKKSRTIHQTKNTIMKKQELLEKLNAMPNCLFTKEQVIEMLESIESEDVLLQKIDPSLLREKAEEILLSVDKDFYIDYEKMDFTLDLDRRVCVMGTNWLNLDYIIMRIVDIMRLHQSDLFESKSSVVAEKWIAIMDFQSEDEEKPKEKGITSDLIEPEDNGQPREKGITSDMIQTDDDDLYNVAFVADADNSVTVSGGFPERIVAPSTGSIIYPYDPDAVGNTYQAPNLGEFDINPENL
jgi:hypothetical protein